MLQPTAIRPIAGEEPDPDPPPAAPACSWCRGCGKQEGATGPDPCGSCRGTGRRPFDRAAHCQRIGHAGGAATLARFGRQHYRALGKAGRAATVRAHGEGYWRGLPSVKRWTPRAPDLLADLAVGAGLARLAA